MSMGKLFLVCNINPINGKGSQLKTAADTGVRYERENTENIVWTIQSIHV